MQPVVTDGVLWSLSFSLLVSWSVCHNCECCKNSWTNQDAGWVLDSGGIQMPACEWAIL